ENLLPFMLKIISSIIMHYYDLVTIILRLLHDATLSLQCIPEGYKIVLGFSSPWTSLMKEQSLVQHHHYRPIVLAILHLNNPIDSIEELHQNIGAATRLVLFQR
ncbi:hypothetical protein ACJX0J_038883, partial [Zea mays]